MQTVMRKPVPRECHEDSVQRSRPGFVEAARRCRTDGAARRRIYHRGHHRPSQCRCALRPVWRVQDHARRRTADRHCDRARLVWPSCPTPRRERLRGDRRCGWVQDAPPFREGRRETSAGQSDRHLHVPEPIDPRRRRLGRFNRFVKERISLELVVIDTHASAMPAPPRTAARTRVAMAAAHKMRDALDAAVLLVHHTNAGGSRERAQFDAWRRRHMVSVTPVDDTITPKPTARRSAPLLKLAGAGRGRLRAARIERSSRRRPHAEPEKSSASCATRSRRRRHESEWRGLSGHRGPHVPSRGETVERNYVRPNRSHFRVTGDGC